VAVDHDSQARIGARPGADDATSEAAGATPARIRSLDAARGFAIVILLLNANPGSRRHLWDQLMHPEWHGVHFADLFFPLFLFAIGAAIPFSRRASSGPLVARRVVLLFAFGLGLQAIQYHSFRPSGVLQHIAISYLVAYLVLRAPRRWQVAIVVAIALPVSWNPLVKSKAKAVTTTTARMIKTSTGTRSSCGLSPQFVEPDL
jgi:predicted acyltransferase